MAKILGLQLMCLKMQSGLMCHQWIKCDIASYPCSQALISDLEMKGRGNNTKRRTKSDPCLTWTHKYHNHGGLRCEDVPRRILEGFSAPAWSSRPSFSNLLMSLLRTNLQHLSTTAKPQMLEMKSIKLEENVNIRKLLMLYKKVWAVKHRVLLLLITWYFRGSECSTDHGSNLSFPRALKEKSS